MMIEIVCVNALVLDHASATGIRFYPFFGYRFAVVILAGLGVVFLDVGSAVEAECFRFHQNFRAACGGLGWAWQRNEEAENHLYIKYRIRYDEEGASRYWEKCELRFSWCGSREARGLERRRYQRNGKQIRDNHERNQNENVKDLKDAIKMLRAVQPACQGSPIEEREMQPRALGTSVEEEEEVHEEKEDSGDHAVDHDDQFGGMVHLLYIYRVQWISVEACGSQEGSRHLYEGQVQYGCRGCRELLQLQVP